MMIITGHRGARGLAQENTLASFEAAITHRVDEIECDVRVTKDGVPILYHDALLNPAHGSHKPISELTYKHIKKGFPGVTTLQEAIEFVNHRVRLLIEVKPHEPTKPVIGVIRHCLDDGWAASELQFASFGFTTLLELHAALPDIKCVVNEGWSSVRVRRRMKQLGTNRCSMNQAWLWWFFIWAMAKHGYEVGSYTINHPPKARRWAKAGLYAAITDYPDRYEADTKR